MCGDLTYFVYRLFFPWPEKRERAFVFVFRDSLYDIIRVSAL